MITESSHRQDIKDVLKELLAEFHTEQGVSQQVYNATVALLKTVSPAAATALEKTVTPCTGKHEGQYLLYGYQDQEIMRYVDKE